MGYCFLVFTAVKQRHPAIKFILCPGKQPHRSTAGEGKQAHDKNYGHAFSDFHKISFS